jgi:tRNA(His) 5'-end guanylyltransferase
MSDSLGDRMKRYEHAFRFSLPQRLPIILRVDGRAFHTFTRGCARPFDSDIAECMAAAATALCEEVQGAQLAYLQSDEISVLIHSYKRFASQAWFDGELQKMCSVSASVATAAFNSAWLIRESNAPSGGANSAHFDARIFVVPEADVTNYFIWRQQDATRNSVQMLARSLYSHKECFEKDNSQLQEMCFAKGKNWNDLDTRWKRGVCVRRSHVEIKHVEDNIYAERDCWAIDDEIPIFTADRSYIDRHLALEES